MRSARRPARGSQARLNDNLPAPAATAAATVAPFGTRRVRRAAGSVRFDLLT
jgi:hypothetical protein